MTYCHAERPRKGIAIVYLIVVMVVMILFASLAVDLGKVQLVRTELRTAVDGAALAAGQGLTISPAEARARAKTAASLNLVNGVPLTLLDSDIEFGNWDATTGNFDVLTGSDEADANAVRINGRLLSSRSTGVKLAFVPIVSGVQHHDVKMTAISAASGLSEDIVLVQDVSGSFSGEIGYAKTGDKALLSSLNVTGSKSYFGTVVFAGTAKTISPMRKVTSSYWLLNYGLNAISVGGYGMPSTSGGTDIAAGIEEAMEVFEHYSNTGNSRSMIIVSDGEPSQSWSGAHPYLSSNALLQLAQSDADAAWAKGINVFVVFWDQNNSTTSANNLKSLIRGKGTFTYVTNPADLPEAIGLIFKRNSKLVK